jgi:dihydrofolate reductase
MFNIILATDDKNGLGKDNSIPWNIPKDVELFREDMIDLTKSINNVFQEVNIRIDQIQKEVSTPTQAFLSPTTSIPFYAGWVAGRTAQ